MASMTESANRPRAVVPPAYYTGNAAELRFTRWAESQGWRVTKRGWPDFICRRGGELMCVEVKDGADHLSRWQAQAAADLAAHVIPVFEWRPPSSWQPGYGELRPVSEVQRLMTEEQLSVFAAADKAVREAQNARLLAEENCRRLEGRTANAAAKVKAKREEAARLRADNDRLADDAGYLLRHILDCFRHYISTRVKALTRRYREELRSEIQPLPGGGHATVQPCGTGWPS
jgi:hypothetical protein